MLHTTFLRLCTLVRSFGTLTMGRPLPFAIFIESIQKTRKLQTPHEKREKESLGSPGRCQISTFKTLQGKPNCSIVNTQDLRLRKKTTVSHWNLSKRGIAIQPNQKITSEGFNLEKPFVKGFWRHIQSIQCSVDSLTHVWIVDSSCLI